MRSLDLLSTWPVGSRRGRVVTASPGGTSVVGARGDIERPHFWASVTKLCSRTRRAGGRGGDDALPGGGGRTAGVDGGPPPGPRLGAGAVGRGGARGPGPSPDLLQRRFRAPGRAPRRALGHRLHRRTCTRRCSTPSACARRGYPGRLAGRRHVRVRPRPGVLATESLATLIAPVTWSGRRRSPFPASPACFPASAARTLRFGARVRAPRCQAPHWTGATNSPRTFGHFGQAGGFLWVDPEVQVACVSLSDRAFGSWAPRRGPASPTPCVPSVSPCLLSMHQPRPTTSGRAVP